MLLTIHNLAKTYKMLPSEVLSKGTTFDLYILDTFSRYVKYQETKKSGKPVLKPPPKLTQEQMKAMIEAAKHFKLPKERKK